MSRRSFLRSLKNIADQNAVYSDQRLRELAGRPADREAMHVVLQGLERILTKAAGLAIRSPTIDAAHHQAERLRKALAEVVP